MLIISVAVGIGVFLFVFRMGEVIAILYADWNNPVSGGWGGGGSEWMIQDKEVRITGAMTLYR